MISTNCKPLVLGITLLAALTACNDSNGNSAKFKIRRTLLLMPVLQWKHKNPILIINRPIRVRHGLLA